MRDGPRVLYVVHGAPHVPAPGGPTRTYHLLRQLARAAEVTALCVLEPSVRGETAAIDSFCRRVDTVPAPAVRSCHGWPERLLCASRPTVLWRFDPKPVREAMHRLLCRGCFDAVVVEHTELAYALADIVGRWGGVSVADLHNVLSVHEERSENVAGSDAVGTWMRVRRVRAIERAILRAYSTVSCVSETDREHLQRLEPGANVRVVRNGVDIRYFGAVSPDRVSRRVVFTGALWYRPNVDGLSYLTSQIWPLIRDGCPEAALTIVGARPGREVRTMAGLPGVTVHGSVPDVRPYLQQSAVAAVPLRMGTGTRLKILEALAAHLPVVSTTVGAEGLDLVACRDFLRADTTNEFAGAVVRLLNDPDDGRALAAAGNRLVQKYHAWHVIGQMFRRVVVGEGVATDKESA